jgi:hypothetical protein
MQQVHRWQFQYIGTTTIPKDLEVVELSAFFTYGPAELAEITNKRKDPLRIAAAVQLGFLKMTGSPLSDLSSIPLRLLRHVATQLGVKAPAIATLRSIYDRDKTRLEHQWWAMKFLGFRKADKQALAPLPSYLENEARYSADRDTLVQRAKLWLYQHKYLSLAQRDLDSLAAAAATTSETAFLSYLTSLLSETQIKQWTKAVMRIEQSSQRTYLEWLHQPARKKSVNAIREKTARVSFLKGLGVDKLNLDSIPLEKIRAYAEQMRNIRPARFKELQDPLRTLRLVCFLKWTLLEAILAAALAVRAGQWPRLSDDVEKPISFLSCSTDERLLADLAVDLYSLDPKNTQILVSKKEGAGGAKRINEEAQRRHTATNPPVLASDGESTGLHVGDPVLCTRNLWDHGLQNGSMGLIVRVEDPAQYDAEEPVEVQSSTLAWVQWDDGVTRPLLESQLDDVTLGYAITVHKAQGSQWRRVIIPAISNRMLDRSLLYTALTRAQAQVILLGDIDAARRAVEEAPRSHFR